MRPCVRSTPSSRFGGLLLLLALVGCDSPADDDGAPSDPAFEACEGTSPFQSDDCMAAVSDRCRALETDEACWEAEPVGDVWCTWTRVRTVLDADACGLDEAFGRCEASLAVGFADGALAEACVDGMFFEGSTTIFPDAMELVDVLPHPSGQNVSGVLGPWVDTPQISACGIGVADEPAWCACAEQACVE